MNSTRRCRRRILRDTLKDKSVVIFRTPDAADDDVDAMSRMRRRRPAAAVTGTIGLTQEFVDANSAEKLLFGGQLADRASGSPS